MSKQQQTASSMEHHMFLTQIGIVRLNLNQVEGILKTPITALSALAAIGPSKVILEQTKAQYGETQHWLEQYARFEKLYKQAQDAGEPAV